VDCTIEGHDDRSVSRNNSLSVDETSIRLIARVHSNGPLESSGLETVTAPSRKSGLCKSNSSCLTCSPHITERSLSKVSDDGKDSLQLTDCPVDTPVPYSFVHGNSITGEYLSVLFNTMAGKFRCIVLVFTTQYVRNLIVPELFGTNCRMYSRIRQQVAGSVCPNTGPSSK
jgi:hypothetical protein